MKKRTLLSFAAAATIGLAGAGSYAAWEKVTATSSGTMAVPAYINMTGSNFGAVTADMTGGTPVFNADASFNLLTANNSDYTKLELKVSVKDGATEVPADAYTIAVKDGATEMTGTGNTYVDESPIFEADQKYGITISIKDDANGQALANKNLAVEVTGTLKK